MTTERTDHEIKLTDCGLTLDESRDGFVRASGDMRKQPEALVVDVAGASVCRLVMDLATTEAIAAGTIGVRIDSEISNDGGQSWKSYGIDPWEPGQQCTKKHTQHFVENKSPRRSVWPAGTQFRFFWRQTAVFDVGVSIELEKP